MLASRDLELALPEGNLVLSYRESEGLLILEVELDTGHTGILRIDCLIGNPPAAAAEGFELALRSGPNFQTEVRGGTVFFRFF